MLTFEFWMHWVRTNNNLRKILHSFLRVPLKRTLIYSPNYIFNSGGSEPQRGPILNFSTSRLFGAKLNSRISSTGNGPYIYIHFHLFYFLKHNKWLKNYPQIAAKLKYCPKICRRRQKYVKYILNLSGLLYAFLYVINRDRTGTLFLTRSNNFNRCEVPSVYSC